MTVSQSFELQLQHLAQIKLLLILTDNLIVFDLLKWMRLKWAAVPLLTCICLLL